MRFIRGVALMVALMSTLLPPAFAAPSQQGADVLAALSASAQAMDAATSLSFSGAMDVTVSAANGSTAMNMPMSGAYQAPDRMMMAVQMPDLGTSMEVVMVGGQVWKRTGRGPWKATPASSDAYASPLGMSHADWVASVTEPAVTDLGSSYRIDAGMDVSDALKAGFTGATGPGRSNASVDFSGTSAKIALTIDKTTNYMMSMQMDLAFPMPDYSATMTMAMSISFAEFNSMAVDILPPV